MDASRTPEDPSSGGTSYVLTTSPVYARALLDCSRSGLTSHAQNLEARAWEILVAAPLHTLSLMSHDVCQLHVDLSGTTILTPV
jgi:hypothetical protein